MSQMRERERESIDSIGSTAIHDRHPASPYIYIHRCIHVYIYIYVCIHVLYCHNFYAFGIEGLYRVMQGFYCQQYFGHVGCPGTSHHLQVHNMMLAVVLKFGRSYLVRDVG